MSGTSVFRIQITEWSGKKKEAPADFARVARHPRLNQPMRLVDLLFFVAEHDDHHLAVIRHLGYD